MSALKKIHLPSALVLGVSAIGISVLLGMAAMLALAALLFLLIQAEGDNIAFLSMSVAWVNGFLAILIFPAALFSLFRILDRPLHLPAVPRWVAANTALILWPVVLGAGFLLARLTGLTWLFLPPLQILAIGIPIWWLVSFTGRRLDTGPVSTWWKLFSMVVLVGNPLIFIIELLVVLPLSILWISGQPGFASLIESLTRDIQNSGMDAQVMNQAVTAIFAYPGLVTALIIGASVLAPLVEETMKTIGVWLLFKNNLTPARGLVAGVVCGAGFALVESLGVINQSFEGSVWVAVMVGRLGTAVMHIFTAGLTGWGIASLASGRKYSRAVLGYTAAIIAHGLWNFLVISTAIQPFLDFSIPQNRWFEPLGNAGIILTSALAFLYLAGLYMANRRLRPDSSLSPSYEVKL